MWEILEVLRRAHRGEKLKTVARSTGRSRNAVKRHLAKAEELSRCGVEVTYTSLYRFAVKHCGFGAKRTTVRMADVAPGELVEVDFGRLGLIQDCLLERRRGLHALVVTLVHSRHQYVRSGHASIRG